MSRPPGAWALAQVFYDAPFGSRWENLVWLKPDSSLPGTFDVQDAAADFNTAWAAVVAPAMSDSNNILGVKLMVNNGTYTVTGEDPTAHGGTDATGAYPPDDSLIVRSQFGAAGMNAKGRILIGGLGLAMAAGGRLSTTGVTRAQAIVAMLTAAISLNGAGFTAQQYDHKNNVLHTPAFWSFNSVFGNVRRRSPIL